MKIYPDLNRIPISKLNTSHYIYLQYVVILNLDIVPVNTVNKGMTKTFINTL